MEQHGGARSLALDLGARAPVVRQPRDELAGRVGVGLARGQPEEERRERVAERLGEHGHDLFRLAPALAHFVLEVAHATDALVARPAETAVDEILDA